MTDREEREEHIKRLEAALACEEKQSSGKCSKQTCDDNCALLYEQGNWGEWKETLRYAINSLKIDLKYDLLYEETSEQADKPITKNCESCRYYGSHHKVCNYCYKCSLWTEQEPKPMVEIDLYSVIKQKYIERDVLDKLRAEIETKYGQCDICEYFEDYDYEENDISEYRPIGDIADILEIIDKYKGESEG